MNKAPCKVDECARESYVRGWCTVHYDRVKKYGEPGSAALIKRSRHTPRPACSVAGCDRPTKSSSLCSLHYDRLRRNGDVGPAQPRKALWGQGTLVRGYRKLMVDGKHQFEHRVIMERNLGRPLLPTETVHHKNGDRADNRIDNLELWSSAQPAGQRVDDKVAYALEILALYAPHCISAVEAA